MSAQLRSDAEPPCAGWGVRAGAGAGARAEAGAAVSGVGTCACAVPPAEAAEVEAEAVGPGLGDRLGGGSPSRESNTSSMVVDVGLGRLSPYTAAAAGDAGDEPAAAAAAPAAPACMPNATGVVHRAEPTPLN